MNTATPFPGSPDRLLISVIAILSIVLISIVGYKLSPLMLPKTDRIVFPAADCNLHKGDCAIDIGSGKLTLGVTPRPVPLVKPIQVRVHAEGLAVRRIDADFAGVGMNMGLNRTRLQSQGNGQFQGNTSLPVCITGTMQWELTLLVETDAELIQVPLRFATPEAGGS